MRPNRHYDETVAVTLLQVLVSGFYQNKISAYPVVKFFMSNLMTHNSRYIMHQGLKVGSFIPASSLRPCR